MLARYFHVCNRIKPPGAVRTKLKTSSLRAAAGIVTRPAILAQPVALIGPNPRSALRQDLQARKVSCRITRIPADPSR